MSTNLDKLTKSQLKDLVMAQAVEIEQLKDKLEHKGSKAKVVTAPLPEKPKLGVHCHKLGCQEVTDVRGFFCCGNHGCDHS